MYIPLARCSLLVASKHCIASKLWGRFQNILSIAMERAFADATHTLIGR